MRVTSRGRQERSCAEYACELPCPPRSGDGAVIREGMTTSVNSFGSLRGPLRTLECIDSPSSSTELWRGRQAHRHYMGTIQRVSGATESVRCHTCVCRGPRLLKRELVLDNISRLDFWECKSGSPVERWTGGRGLLIVADRFGLRLYLCTSMFSGAGHAYEWQAPAPDSPDHRLRLSQ